MDTTGIKIDSKYKKFSACGPGKRCVLKKDNSKSDTTKSAPLKSGKDTTRIEAPKREKRKIQILDDSLLKSRRLEKGGAHISVLGDTPDSPSDFIEIEITPHEIFLRLYDKSIYWSRQTGFVFTSSPYSSNTSGRPTRLARLHNLTAKDEALRLLKEKEEYFRTNHSFVRANQARADQIKRVREFLSTKAGH